MTTEKNVSNHLPVGAAVIHNDGRKGRVIAQDLTNGRVRVRWTGLGKNLRTWMRTSVLRKLEENELA